MQADRESAETPQGTDMARILGVDRSADRRRRYIRWGGLALAVVVLLLLALQWFGYGRSSGLNYNTVAVTRGSLSVTVSATGTLEPVNQVEVGSEISGTIKAVMVDFNDRVEQGQVLAVMDTEQLQARVNKAKASLEMAQAKVRQAEATVIETKNSLHRARELEKTGMCSAEQCDTAQAVYSRAEADLASARAQVMEAQSTLDAEQTTLARATIHAPISGIVLSRAVEPGQTVAASFQTPVLFVLAEDLTQMELHVDVDEADVGEVREGLQAEFTVDAYANRTFPASITEVHFASHTVDGVVSYETVLSVDNSALLLRPGMTATADIQVRQVDNALLVPNAALRFAPPVQQQQAESGGGSLLSHILPHPPRVVKSRDETASAGKQQQLWVLHDGQPLAIPVTTGVSDGNMTEITGGDIEPGMAVIVDTSTDDR